MQLEATRMAPDDLSGKRYFYNVCLEKGEVVARLVRYTEISRPSRRHRNWRTDAVWDSFRAPGHGLYRDPGKPAVPPDVDEEILAKLTGTVTVQS